MRQYKLKLSKLSVTLAGILLLNSQVFASDAQFTLESHKAPEGMSYTLNDSAWETVKPLKITLDQTPYKPNKYPGITTTEVSMKSLYDDNNLYIHIQYKDPTRSMDYFPWEKQADGSWKVLSNKDQTDHENTYYEDKMGLYWDISTRGFAKRGCGISCHLTREGKNNGFPDTSAGRKYTRREGQTIDMWHWKAVRTGPYNLTHDQYVDHISDPSVGRSFGRHGDEKTAGGYPRNRTDDKKMPKYMNKDPESKLTYILDADKVPFVDTFQPGDRVPGLVIKKMEGSAADIHTLSEHKDGQWTLVFKRALTTDHPKSAVQDVQFTDLSKPYHFGISVFDNTQINHIYHDGSIQLLFK